MPRTARRALPRARRLALLSLAALPAIAVAQPAHADHVPQFAPDTVLPGSGGAEPSLAIDLGPAHRNALYVTAISPGANIWHSYDAGRTWSQPVAFDTSGTSRGGDADVAVAQDGTVYVVDLDITHNWVQSSSDGATTFTGGAPTAFEADRPWITAGPGKTVYVAYHDFAAELPVVCTSTDGAQTFTRCMDSAQGMAAVPCAENTNVSKKLHVDPSNGALNFLFECSTAQENLRQPPYGPVHDYYLAQSTDGGLTYTVHPVYIADTSGGKAPTLANFWTSLWIDDAGNYYALMDGSMDDTHPLENPFHVWLLTSTDHGHTWRAPVQVDREADGRGTHVLSDIVATAPGQVDIVFYGTTATGEPNGVCGDFASQGPCPENSGFVKAGAPGAPAWYVSMAQSLDALDANPSFTQTRITAAPTHYGELCTNGLVCNQSDRTLLDYISAGVDCTGAAHVAFAGNPDEATGGDVRVHEVDQVGGKLLSAPAACGEGQVASSETAPATPASSPAPAATTALPNTSSGAGSPAVAAGLTAAALAGSAWSARRRRRRSTNNARGRG
jgi:LPXTG-motif cell wall-anchored protein